MVSRTDSKTITKIYRGSKLWICANTLVHRYGTRNTKIIWDVMAKDIPILMQQCKTILLQVNPDIDNDIKAELEEETNILP